MHETSVSWLALVDLNFTIQLFVSGFLATTLYGTYILISFFDRSDQEALTL